MIESKQELHTCLLEALHYLVLISEVEEKEIFKICLEYWNCLASDLYREVRYNARFKLKKICALILKKKTQSKHFVPNNIILFTVL